MTSVGYIVMWDSPWVCEPGQQVVKEGASNDEVEANQMHKVSCAFVISVCVIQMASGKEAETDGRSRKVAEDVDSESNQQKRMKLSRPVGCGLWVGSKVAVAVVCVAPMKKGARRVMVLHGCVLSRRLQKNACLFYQLGCFSEGCMYLRMSMK